MIVCPSKTGEGLRNERETSLSGRLSGRALECGPHLHTLGSVGPTYAAPGQLPNVSAKYERRGVSNQLTTEESLVPKSLPKVTGSRASRFQSLGPGSLPDGTGEPLKGEGGSVQGGAGAKAQMRFLSLCAHK